MQLLGNRSVAWWIKLLLDAAWWLLLGLSALVLIQGLHFALTRDASQIETQIGVQIEFEPERFVIDAPELGIEGGEIEKATGNLKFSNPSRAYALTILAWTYVGLAILLISVFQLRKIFGSLARGAPFEAENGRRLRIIALAIIAGQVARALMAFAASRGVDQEWLAPGITLRPNWGVDLASLLFALMILVLAEVFRQGAKMKEEQDLTV